MTTSLLSFGRALGNTYQDVTSTDTDTSMYYGLAFRKSVGHIRYVTKFSFYLDVPTKR